MASTTRTTRLTRCTTAATAIAAVLSVAGAASAASGPAHYDVRSGLSDAQVVRVFAAVFEAMARDLLKPGRTYSAIAESPLLLTGGEPVVSPLTIELAYVRVVEPLPARLLDLPPPAC